MTTKALACTASWNEYSDAAVFVFDTTMPGIRYTTCTHGYHFLVSLKDKAKVGMEWFVISSITWMTVKNFALLCIVKIRI